ncbi:MAG: transglycosylase SLT domain-containing protein [Geminicoccaceae bacterium]
MAERLRVWVPALFAGALVLALAGGVIWFVPGRSPVPEVAPPAGPALVPTPAVVEEEMPDEGIAANPPWTGDLDGMVERRLVRLLVVPSRTDYYLDQGEPKGVTAEYAREFERRLNRRFQTGARPIRVVFVPVVRDELLPGLGSGKGDIATANLTITPERQQIVDFSPPIRSDVREIVVTGPDSPTLASLEDLAGREILTRRSSSYWASLEALDGRLRADGLMGLRLQAVLEAVDDEDLLELVASGRLPLAVVDDHKARAWQRALPTLVLHDDLGLRSGGDIAWAYRKGSPQLAASLVAFTKATAKGTEFGNVVANRYLVAAEQLRTSDSADRKRFLELLALFEKWGGCYRFDPLLLAAQGYQESGLDQKRRSPSGAVGIMQIRPETAQDPTVGVARIDRLENNVQAGAKYLRHLIDVYFPDPDIVEFDRMLLALAAYNAGPSRIADLRRRAARRGLDANRWFGEVELQAERDLGRETVAYVGNIVKYYTVYRGITEQEEARRLARTQIVAR